MQSTDINFLQVVKEDMITVQVPKDLWSEILVMVQGDVFNVPYGRVTLNYAEHKIASISIDKRTYDRKDIHKPKVGPV